MEGWSLLLQESPCLMEGGMEGRRGVKNRKIVRKERERI